MSRIKIEDLPVVEDLTAEEKELILGAGRPSFRPILESLENREMMDAGLGYGLQIPLSQQTGGNQLALVRQLGSETTQQVNPVVGSAMQTAQQVNQFVHSALGPRRPPTPQRVKPSSTSSLPAWVARTCLRTCHRLCPRTCPRASSKRP